MTKLDHDKALNSQELMNHLDAITEALQYQCMSKAGLAIGSTSKKAVKIANTVNYQVNGVMCQKTTAEVAFTATTHDIAANAGAVRERCYLLSLAANGDVTVTAGNIATGAGNAVVPATPSGKTPIGYVRVAVAAGSTAFDATSDDLDAAHLTVAYVDMGHRFAKFSANYEVGGVTAA